MQVVKTRNKRNRAERLRQVRIPGETNIYIIGIDLAIQKPLIALRIREQVDLAARRYSRYHSPGYDDSIGRRGSRPHKDTS